MRRPKSQAKVGQGSPGELAGLNAAAHSLLHARRALAAGDVQEAAVALRTGLMADRTTFMKNANREICELVWLSEQRCLPIEELEAQDIQEALECAAEQNNVKALFVLGRALCALACGPNVATALVTRKDMRRGVALLARAANEGCAEAWLHLYDVALNGPSLVNSPKMAEFCRRKAAAAGLLHTST